jgi:flagellar biosynthesis component FlhA
MRYFPNARLMPLSAFITKAAAAKFQHQLQCIIAAVTPEHVTLACIRNKMLLLLSTQDAKTSDDVLYHLSNAAMRLEMDLENCAVELVASAGREELTTLLRRYVKDVRLLHRTEVTNCSVFNQLHYLCA